MFSRCGIRLSQGMQGFGGREGSSHRLPLQVIICSDSSVLELREKREREQEIEELWPSPGLALKLTSPPLTLTSCFQSLGNSRWRTT